MKGVLLVALLIVAGCAPHVSLEQLEDEALVSGDWTKVEARERLLARQNQRRGRSCPQGSFDYCEVNSGQQRCTCVDREYMSSFLQR